MAMTKSSIIFVKKKEENWIVIRKDSKRATKVLGTQAEAIKYGRQFAKKQAAKLSIYKADGKLKESISYNKKTPSSSKPSTTSSKRKSSLKRELKTIFQKTGQQPKRFAKDVAIVKVEKTIGMNFSKEYTNFLKSGGTSIDTYIELFKINEIAKETKKARKYVKLPETLIPIGYDNGDYFCITESGKIVNWYHDSKMVEKS